MGCPCQKRNREPAVTSAQLQAEDEMRRAQDPDGSKAAAVLVSAQRAVGNTRS